MSVKFDFKYAERIFFGNDKYTIFNIKKAAKNVGFALDKLPYSLRVLFENVVRHNPNLKVLQSFKSWLNDKSSKDEIGYMPARILMQDFTGVPAIVDLASMRDAMKALGGDPEKINPMIPVDLIIDHSVQVDSYGHSDSFSRNVSKEIERNKERYEFLKWGQNSFDNFRVVPPGTGICHQVNLEYLAETVRISDYEGEKVLYPDTLVGTDSHTTMINALSVLGWGVGGIEAESAMLGQPITMIIPEVVGVNLTGNLRNGVTATDLVLTITQILRKKGVVRKFVEFFGSGLDHLALADRATISNMAPEYGATCGFFPIDDEALKYLHLTGRDMSHIKMVEEYAKIQGFWRNDNLTPEYSEIVELDMSTVGPSLAGPKRPQDRVSLADMQENFKEALPFLAIKNPDIKAKHKVADAKFSIGNGDVVIAAITSCTNTSNPSVMIASALVAKKACELGIKVKPWVKTSLAPGSKVVTEYLNKTGLSEYLDDLGFNLVGYGCTTCIGNSGPLPPDIDEVIKDKELVVASVLSGNRNFEGRVHPLVRANYLASPPLVVAYALAGTVNIDLDEDVIAKSKDGKDIYLKDLWPTNEEIQSYVGMCITPEMFIEKYKDVFQGDVYWQNINSSKSATYNWDKDSTYIKNPPYFDNIKEQENTISDIKNAEILALFGDSITTDHISPAGVISSVSEAAKFLENAGVLYEDFNSYGSRRGNHEVMMRGTFANVRIRNLMCENVEGGFTINHLTGKQTSIYQAAMDYKKVSKAAVVFAGKEYGTGSSRDWAAKGTNLLGVKAVIADSFERIHRSNLVGMGVLPISFDSPMCLKNLDLQGDEEIDILGLDGNIEPYQKLKCFVKKKNGNNETVDITLQAYTDNEIEYIKHGSILASVIKILI